MNLQSEIRVSRNVSTVHESIMRDSGEIFCDLVGCKAVMDTHLRSLETPSAVITFIIGDSAGLSSMKNALNVGGTRPEQFVIE